MSSMHRKESLGVEPGDRIIWTGSPRMTIHEDGHRSVFIDTGTRGVVLSIHDGDEGRLEAPLGPTPAWALVEFENGETAAEGRTMEWERAG